MGSAPSAPLRDERKLAVDDDGVYWVKVCACCGSESPDTFNGLRRYVLTHALRYQGGENYRSVIECRPDVVAAMVDAYNARLLEEERAS